MGNYRFRLSDMLPNAWFYKLKYITKNKSPTTNKKHHPTTTVLPPLSSNQMQPHHHLSQPRRSYHVTRDKFSPTDPPRKSSKKKRTTRRHHSPNLVTTTNCTCRTSINSISTKPDSTPEHYPASPRDSSTEKESVLQEQPGNLDDHKKSNSSKFQIHNRFDKIVEMDLPPIITKTKQPLKSANIEERKECETLITKEPRRSSVRGFSVSSPAGLKLRTNSPRIVNKKIQGNGRKSVSSTSRRRINESVAVVKRSDDPQRDFKESMVEMIMENEIRTSKDLEDLLACYLSLNSDEYHHVIIKVFKQIWFDVTDVRVK